MPCFARTSAVALRSVGELHPQRLLTVRKHNSTTGVPERTMPAFPHPSRRMVMAAIARVPTLRPKLPLTHSTLPLSLPSPSLRLAAVRSSPSHLPTFLRVSARSAMATSPSPSPQPGAESFLRSVLAAMEKVYLNRNPTAKAILDLVHSCDGDNIHYDHFAFRTFGVDGHGIDSMASFFMAFGYKPREELRFPKKKLKALWFAPPEGSYCKESSRVDGPLPRVFISELLVNEMSSQMQEVVRKYIKMSGNGNKYAALSSLSGSLTWEKPSYADFQQLSKESEYAAWTLVNGYALNHVTISTHRLKSNIRNINNFNKFIEDNGYKLNSEGGILKVSPDGLLLQSSTVADSITYQFSDGVIASVPCAYIEFAERHVLPQFKNLHDDEVKEVHRRDGFEVGNADKIFESTSKDQVTRNT